jgi:hypothetical protein
LRLIAQLVGVAEQLLLLLWVLFEVRLHTKEQVLVGERLEVVRFQRERLVDRFEPGLDVFDLLRLGRREVAVGLLPVERGDRVVGLGLFGSCVARALSASIVLSKAPWRL